MKTLLYKMAYFVANEEGPTVVEYAFMMALLIIVCITAISLIGGKVSATFTTLESGLPASD